MRVPSGRTGGRLTLVLSYPCMELGHQLGRRADVVDAGLLHLCSVLAETAVNIGYSCKMLTDDMTEVFIVTGHTVLEVREELRSAEARDAVALNSAQAQQA